MKNLNTLLWIGVGLGIHVGIFPLLGYKISLMIVIGLPVLLFIAWTIERQPNNFDRVGLVIFYLLMGWIGYECLITL